MALRASKRVANRKVNAVAADIAKKKAQRMSVGGALGLTPRKPKGKNLQEAMAEEAAVAAAARLDGFSDAERRGITKRKKRGKSTKTNDRRKSYHPSSRASLALMHQTKVIMESAEEDDEGEQEEMPALDGETDPEDRDDNASSIIATPGPREAPDTADKRFIKRDSEGESSPEKSPSDPDYVPTEDEDVDDEEDEDGEAEAVNGQ